MSFMRCQYNNYCCISRKHKRAAAHRNAPLPSPLIVNHLVIYDLPCPCADAVHPADPSHLIFGFHSFLHALPVRHLLYQPRKHIHCLPVKLRKVAFQLSGHPEFRIQPFPILLKIPQASLPPNVDWRIIAVIIGEIAPWQIVITDKHIRDSSLFIIIVLLHFQPPKIKFCLRPNQSGCLQSPRERLRYGVSPLQFFCFDDFPQVQI